MSFQNGITISLLIVKNWIFKCILYMYDKTVVTYFFKKAKKLKIII